MIKAYRTEIDPNNKQLSLFRQMIGASRFIYNWGLAEWQRQYEAGEKPSQYKLRKQFNAQKDDTCPWIRDLPYSIIEAEFINLGNAFDNFFRRVKNGCEEVGYPRFKRRGVNNSFQLRGYRVDGRTILLGRMVGSIRIKEVDYIPDGMRYTPNVPGGGVYVTVSLVGGRWFVSVPHDDGKPEPPRRGGDIIGVDFGSKSLAVCSDGTVYENPHILREALPELSRLNKELSRRTPGGENWQKTKLKLQRCYAKIASRREWELHNISHDLVINKKPGIIVLEDLNVSGMMQNRHLSLAISDLGLSELRRQIEYKAKTHGVKVIIASRWFPSSKLCSECGAIKENLTLADRTYICECGAIIDRDLNAARNLAAYGLKAETRPDCLGSCEGESHTGTRKQASHGK
jgi:putative transposase